MSSSLIEVLISFLLLSIVALGMTHMQHNSVQTARAAYYISVAQSEVENMLRYLELTAQLPTTDDSDGIELWRKHVANVLPQGNGEIHGYYPNQTIAIYWGGATASSCRDTHADVEGCLIFT